MGRKALCIGCNYPGSKAELQGCVNDVWDFKRTLTECLGFADESVTIFVDTDDSFTKPTGKNIKSKLREMVAEAADGDILFIHFSGHGTQIPSDDPEEKDAKDEAICPCDMNVITDADLSLIFAPLAEKNVKLTFVADCCHSGTMLDHDEVIITGPKDGTPPPPQATAASMQSMLASLGASGDTRDVKNRSLPSGDFMEILSGMMGGKKVDASNARSSMGSLFGDDASAKSMDYGKYIDMAKQIMAMMPSNSSGDGGGKSKMFSTLASLASSGGASGGAAGQVMGMLGGGGGGDQKGGKGGKKGGGGGAAKMFACCFKGDAGDENGEGGKPSGGGSAPQGSAGGAYVTGADSKKHAYARLDDDVGILLSGCMSKETAADAMPSGKPAHGAFSNAVNTILRQQHGQSLTNRNLILSVRDSLSKAGFQQSPCLECAERWADAPFVVQE